MDMSVNGRVFSVIQWENVFQTGPLLWYSRIVCISSGESGGDKNSLNFEIGAKSDGS